MMAALTVSCGSDNDESEGGGETFVPVTESGGDTWVSDKDITDDDLLMLTDLYVKVEYMRLEFIKMLSNNFEGDKLFCGDGSKSNYDPTIKTFTRMMVNEEKYKAALNRLEASSLMKPTTRGVTSSLINIFKAFSSEGKRAQQEIQDNLKKMADAGQYDNQAQ